MRLVARKYLHVIARASDLVAEFVGGAGFDDYAEIDDRLVWDIVESKLPILRREVAALIEGG